MRKTKILRQIFLAVMWLIWMVELVVTSQAMEIYKFDQMAGPDQDEYIALLVQGAQSVLKDDGRADDAAKVHQLFTANDTNGVSIGMNKFMITLALARKSDADRLVKDPNATRLQVEHAMYIMLKKDGVILPKTLMHVADDFRPKHPGQKQ